MKLKQGREGGGVRYDFHFTKFSVFNVPVYFETKNMAAKELQLSFGLSKYILVMNIYIFLFKVFA